MRIAVKVLATVLLVVAVAVFAVGMVGRVARTVERATGVTPAAIVGAAPPSVTAAVTPPSRSAAADQTVRLAMTRLYPAMIMYMATHNAYPAGAGTYAALAVQLAGTGYVLSPPAVAAPAIAGWTYVRYGYANALDAARPPCTGHLSRGAELTCQDVIPSYTIAARTAAGRVFCLDTWVSLVDLGMGGQPLRPGVFCR